MRIDFDLTFTTLDLAADKIGVFADVIFASNPGLRPQLDYVIVIMDACGKANTLHYSSFKSKDVTRSVRSSELFACVQVFDYANTMCVTINEIFRRQILLTIYIDLQGLFERLLV